MQLRPIEKQTSAGRNPRHYYSHAAIGPMLDRVYSIRYRSYSSEDYIDKNKSEKFMDEYDPMPNCTSYLTYPGSIKKAIGSIRSCVYTPEDAFRIPVMDVYAKEFESVIGYESVVIEANKFVIDPTFQNQGGVKARFSVYKNIADEIVEHRAQHLVAGIRVEHVKFYKMLNFEPISKVKSYPHLNFETVFVHCSNVDAFCEKIYRKTDYSEIRNGALSNSCYH